MHFITTISILKPYILLLDSTFDLENLLVVVASVISITMLHEATLDTIRTLYWPQFYCKVFFARQYIQ